MKTLRALSTRAVSIAALALAALQTGSAQNTRPRYDIGTPEVDTIWVSPTDGDDSRSGARRSQALATLTEAWGRIPVSTELERGYRIMLTQGTYPETIVPGYWESRRGTFEHPVIVQAADGPNTAFLPPLNIYDCSYLYLLGITTRGEEGDVLHFELCDHLLLRDVIVGGLGDITTFDAPQEALKVNQSRHVYIERCDISGAFDNAVDFVAVQHGHVVDSRIHRTGDWCMYVKGGSAYLTIDGNEFLDGGTGGFTAGQGTGFQFMTSPWIHYEAYDIKVTNNVIYDIDGAGLGVNGGYNILMAYNTIYRCGSRSHMLEIGFGGRSCDGEAGDPGRGACSEYLEAGGWGTDVVDDGTNYARIPNRNVAVYNNLFVNPTGYRSMWSHMTIAAPFDNPPQTNIPGPARADDNLRIRGNVFRNGPTDHPLGLEEGACADGNPDCNRADLLADNAFNTVQPRLASSGDFRPTADDPLLAAATYVIPPFGGGDRPSPPLSPAGDLSNIVPIDKNGVPRGEIEPAGALVVGSAAPPIAPVQSSPLNGVENVPSSTDFVWLFTFLTQSYHLQVSTTPTFETIVAERENVTATQVAGLPLQAGRTYYWRLRATGPGGTSDWSEPWSFTTSESSSGVDEEASRRRMIVSTDHDFTTLRVALEAMEGEIVGVTLTSADGRGPATIFRDYVGSERYMFVHDISTLPSGIYHLRLMSEGGRGDRTERFAVVR